MLSPITAMHGPELEHGIICFIQCQRWDKMMHSFFVDVLVLVLCNTTLDVEFVVNLTGQWS